MFVLFTRLGKLIKILMFPKLVLITDSFRSSLGCIMYQDYVQEEDLTLRQFCVASFLCSAGKTTTDYLQVLLKYLLPTSYSNKRQTKYT